MFKKIKEKHEKKMDDLFKECEDKGVDGKLMLKAMRLGVEDTLISTAPILMTIVALSAGINLADRISKH